VDESVRPVAIDRHDLEIATEVPCVLPCHGQAIAEARERGITAKAIEITSGGHLLLESRRGGREEVVEYPHDMLPRNAAALVRHLYSTIAMERGSRLATLCTVYF
jgi:hypothetical protein